MSLRAAQIAILTFSGLLQVGVGLKRLTDPFAAYKVIPQVKLPNDVNLLNEVRGNAALMMFGGMIIMSGVVKEQMTFASHVVGTLIYAGFGVGRIYSILVDGKCCDAILKGMIAEVVFGGGNILCLMFLV